MERITPIDVLTLKRELDEDLYVNRLLFEPHFFEAYLDFMGLLFRTYAAAERDALIRALVVSEFGDRRSLGWWLPAHSDLFAGDQIPSLGDVRSRLRSARRGMAGRAVCHCHCHVETVVFCSDGRLAEPAGSSWATRR